ncbi:MAG: hypothetical protein AAGA65_13455, partial [Actinomycetota bacterium]
MTWSHDLFGCGPGDLPVAGVARAVWQADELTAAGDRAAAGPPAETGAPGEGVTSDPPVVTGSDVVVSAGYLRALRALAAERRRPVRAAVALGPIHDEFGANTLGCVTATSTAAGEGLAYALTVGCGEASELGVVDPLLTVMSRSPQPGRMASPITGFGGDRFIWSVNHWYDVLVINLLATQSACGRQIANTIAADASVHPTAVVENSTVEPGATVGPFAVVRNAHIGTDTTVEEQVSIRGSIVGPGSVLQTRSMVHGSTVGPETVISFHTAIRGSVVFGRSTISAPVVARSVIGPDTFLARGVSISASTLADTPVVVRVGGRLVDTGARLVGCAVGRGARIGNGIDIPAGYTVPADTRLAARPIPHIEADPPKSSSTTLLLDGGRFRTLPTRRTNPQ